MKSHEKWYFEITCCIFSRCLNIFPLCSSGCYYRGVVYQKGQTWQDGCDYNCVCVDDMSGQYSCTKRFVFNPVPLSPEF